MSVRCIVDYMGVAFMMLSVLLMPVSVSVSISRLQSFVTPVIAFFLIGETLGWAELLSLSGGFMGVIFITNPNLFQKEANNEQVNQRNTLERQIYPYYSLGIFLALSFAVASALSITIMRKLNSL